MFEVQAGSGPGPWILDPVGSLAILVIFLELAAQKYLCIYKLMPVTLGGHVGTTSWRMGGSGNQIRAHLPLSRLLFLILLLFIITIVYVA